MRKGRLEVVFLGSIFPKTLKMHCQVKSLLTESLYVLTLRLFDIFISNNTHRLLVVSTTSSRYWAQNNGRPERSKSVQTEGLTGQTSNVAFMFAFMFTFKIRKKIWNIYTNHRPVIWRKVVRGRRVTLPAESTLPIERPYNKECCPVWELTAGRLSPEFIQALIFLQTFNNRLHHSRRATQLRQFEPDSDFGSIFFLNYNARACSVNLHLAKLTRVGEPKCIPAWQKVFSGRRVTLPSKASGPARRVALLVPAEPSLCFAQKRFDEFSKEMWGKLARPGYLEKAGDPSTRDLTGSESKMLKLLVILFLLALFEGMYSNKLSCMGI